jgi:precorrin-2 dehydrogenase/sirohydrochlorin ferrochelatase
MEENFFPIFINFKGKRCLVVGGGNIAFRKIRTLSNYGALIDVVTTEIKIEEIRELVQNVHIRELRHGDLDGYFFVVAATDSADTNEKIYEEAESKNILVNNITSGSRCNARFAAVLEREEFVVAVSGKGKNPKLAVKIRDKIGDLL